MKADYYQTLGVERTADAETLKKAYRKLAMQYHPDRNPGDAAAEAKFKEISEAYGILSDYEKRQQYDRFGHAAFEQGGGGRGGFDFGGGFADIFNEMFGDLMQEGMGDSAGPGRGADLRYDLTLTLEEAFQGLEKTIKLTTSATCDDCKGSGAKAGSSPVGCDMCRGRGRVRMTQGFFTIERTCPTCAGSGRIIKDPCGGCRGQGRVRRERQLAVTIPAGVEDGTRIRLTGEGEAGLRGAAPGDLYIILSLKPHALFQRDGANLLLRVPVPMPLAALGGELPIPLLDGTTHTITLEAGIQTGSQQRLRGQGMSVLKRATRGDLYLEFYVETPANLNKKQQELLAELQASLSHKHYPMTETFRKKMAG